MSELAQIRGRLRGIARRRFLTRCLAAACAVVAAVTIALLIFFLLDRTFELSRLQRAVTWLSALVAIYWASHTYAWPLLRQREDEVDIALKLQRAGGWSPDFVAALQFDAARAAQLGSPALRQAVIEAVEQDEFDTKLPNDGAGGKLLRRLAAAGIAVSTAVGVCLTVPEATTIFPQRLLLATVYYPRDTQIVTITIHGITLSQPPYRANVLIGSQVDLTVTAEGVKPTEGSLHLAGENIDAKFDLLPAEEQGNYSTTIPRLSESAIATVRLGDAVPVEVALNVLSPPTVSLASAVEPPDYAVRLRGAHDPAQQFFNVPAGSRVRLDVNSLDKPLAEVRAAFGEEVFPLTPTDDSRRHWRFDELPPSLTEVIEPLEIAFQIVDEDGLAPETPLAARVGLLRDRPPQVEANTLLKKLLPTATPVIEFAVDDDFRLGSVEIHATIKRKESDEPETLVTPLPLAAAESPREFAGEQPLNLAPADLQVGDEVEVRVVATDLRHGGRGEPVASPPLEFEVAPMEEVMQAVRELDRSALDNLEQVIERQLGVGVSP